MDTVSQGSIRKPIIETCLRRCREEATCLYRGMLNITKSTIALAGCYMENVLDKGNVMPKMHIKDMGIIQAEVGEV